MTAITSVWNSTKANLPSPDIWTHVTGGPIVGEYSFADCSAAVKKSLRVDAFTAPTARLPT